MSSKKSNPPTIEECDYNFGVFARELQFFEMSKEIEDDNILWTVVKNTLRRMDESNNDWPSDKFIEELVECGEKEYE